MKDHPPSVRRLVAKFGAGLLLTALASTASAGTIWDGGGANTNINTDANWDSDTLPDLTGGTATLTFGTDGSTATINTDVNAAGLIINRNANFTLANGAATSITLGTGGINAGGAGVTASRTYSITEVVALNGNQTWNVTNGSSGTVTLSVNTGGITGISKITKTGNGELVLFTNNSAFSGGIDVNAGTLRIENLGGLGTGVLTTTGASAVTFQFNLSSNQTIANNFVIGSGANAGSLNLNNYQSTNRVITLSGNFTTGSNSGVNSTMSYNPSGSQTTESRLVLSGNHTALTGNTTAGNVTTVNLGGFSNTSSALGAGERLGAAVGTLQFDSQSSIISNTTYTFNGGSTSSVSGVDGVTPLSNKYIINGAFTFASQVTVQNQGTNLNVNSVGTTHTTGTATWSGSGAGTAASSLAVGANRVNVFSQNDGAVFNVSGQIGSADATTGTLFINERYSYTNESGGINYRTPTGTVRLSRADGIAYAGTVSVERGTLEVSNTAGSGTGSGSLVIKSDATLGGTGLINATSGTNTRTITVNGAIAPGIAGTNNGIGTLTLQAYSGIALAGSIAFDVASSTSFDSLTLNSATTLGGSLAFNFQNVFADGTYTGLDFFGGSGAISGNLSTVTVGGVYTAILSRSGNEWTGLVSSGTYTGTSFLFDQSTGLLNVTAVPEPAAFGVLALIPLAFAVARRRRAIRQNS